MARGIHRLTPRKVATLGEGLHHDGGGLYLQVKGNGRSWLFRYGTHWMGLGSADTWGLAEARERARLCRQQRDDGIDPIEARKAAKLNQELAKAKDVTFRECAEGWMATNRITWTPRYADAVKRKFEMFVYPKLGDLPVQKFDMRGDGNSAVDLIHGVLKPIWENKTKTAELVQQYIEGALNWAIAKHYIAGNNAASLKGPLQFLLPKVKAFYVTKHHDALPWQEAGQFMAQLRACADNTGRIEAGSRSAPGQATPRCKVCAHPDRLAIEAARRGGASLDNLADRFGINRNSIHQHCKRHLGIPNVAAIRRPVAAHAIELIMLTAVRKQQAIGARWDEFDRNARLWRCPWQRTKTGKQSKRDHLIPLSDAALAVLDSMQEIQKANGVESEYVFPGGRGGDTGHLSVHAPGKFLKESLGRPDITLHGFRTCFRSWAKQHFPDRWAAAEMILDHAVPDLERIYGRDADLLDDRRMLLDAWAAHCDRSAPLPDAAVLPFRQAK